VRWQSSKHDETRDTTLYMGRVKCGRKSVRALKLRVMSFSLLAASRVRGL
jgi:hypothetical protein